MFCAYSAMVVSEQYTTDFLFSSPLASAASSRPLPLSTFPPFADIVSDVRHILSTTQHSILRSSFTR